MHNGFLRVAACSPAVAVADIDANINNIITLADEAAAAGARVAVFPEMSVTGYTCADLFHQQTLIEAVDRGLRRLLDECNESLALAVVGAPVIFEGSMYNCAVMLRRGRVLGVVPKTFLPNYNEFYEKRWFASALTVAPGASVNIAGSCVPFGTDLIFDVDGIGIGAELCEDLWAPVPPSCRLALSGAEVLVNLSASDDIIGKYDYLRSLIAQQSARCLAAYVYSSAGYGESSTDLVFDGKTVICENGRILAEGDRHAAGNKLQVADIDIDAIRRDRMHNITFGDCAAANSAAVRRIACTSDLSDKSDPSDKSDNLYTTLLRSVDPHPFVPADKHHLAERCRDIIHIQSRGLRRRLDAIRCKSLVVGISGGLDSTLALLVAVDAFDEAGLDRRGIVGVTMPGFGTTDRTHDNAVTLMQSLGVTTREISIAAAVNQHFSDIGHDASVHDVTYENSQARERTQILMDVANQVGGIVLGTGDLSELALGWATYNGDHMSMYGVNAGVPKTLVRHLVTYFADTCDNAVTAAALRDIVDTPISPELIPADEHGNITQKTEDLVGPYELHDFFLYYTLRYGYSPRKVYLLARTAFAGIHSDAVIKKWLATFYRRFFTQQFKRSCLPDGPKVGSVTLSPRGDWRMPSDASAAMWLKECNELE